MVNKNNLFEDISKLAGNAAGVVLESGKSLQSKVKGLVTKSLSEMDVITREEFEIVKKMAEKARLENEDLKKRLDKIEGKKPSSARKSTPISKAKKATAAKTNKKTATKKPTTEKPKTSKTIKKS